MITFTVEGEKCDIGAGEVLFIPRGAVHRFDNFQSDEAKIPVIITPGILGPDYFREIAEIVRATVSGPPDQAAIAQVMRRHGLTPAE